jgi:hypothetical protein
VADWAGFRSERPDLAEAATVLLYQHGVGLAFLATCRPDARPRLHPMCPVLTDDGLFAFIVPSPKQRDLRRDGWYAMHSFPCPQNEDACYLTGRAHVVDDAGVRATASAQFVAERSQFAPPPPSAEELLFAFDVDTCMITRTTGHGDPAPQHTIWHAP